MKRITAIFVLTLIAALPLSHASAGSVRSYVTKKGTFVQTYSRTTKNSTKLDNYSTKGNYNPYTGKVGTKNSYSW